MVPCLSSRGSDCFSVVVLSRPDRCGRCSPAASHRADGWTCVLLCQLWLRGCKTATTENNKTYKKLMWGDKVRGRSHTFVVNCTKKINKMKVFGQPWCIMGRINETEIPSLISNLSFLAVCEKTQSKYKEPTLTLVALPAFLHQYSLTHSLTHSRFESPELAGWPQPTGSDPTACFLDGNVFRLTHISYLETFTRKTPNEKPDKKAWDEMFSTRLLLLRCFQSGPSRFSGAHWESLLQDLQPLPWMKASV